MNALTAVDQLGELPPAELEAMFPEDGHARCVFPRVGRGIVLVSFLAAGISLSGQRADCRTIDDLRSAWRHFRSLWDGEVVSDEQWSAAATDVFQQIEQEALRLSMQIGRSHEPQRPQFSRAELN